MAVYILSILLIIILAFAIYQLSKKSEVEAEIKQLKQRDQLSLIAELRAAEKVVWLCFSGGLLLTANYAITYFSGSELVNTPHWGFLQWSGALMGLVIAVSITFVQKVLYSSPTHSKAGLVVTTLVLIFVIISEIGAPIEKEGMKMKEASQNSAVFKAVVGQIQGSTDATALYSSQIALATAEKTQHEFELKRCERHQAKGEKRVQRCEEYENKQIAQAQAKIDSYQNSASTTRHRNESSRLSLIQHAKALERNTDNHSELVKLTASILGANFLASMMFLSLILIVAFEAGFHFVGSRVGILKITLSELGNKEILRHQQLASLKKEKRFKDESGYIDPHNTLQPNQKETVKPKPKDSTLSIPPTISKTINRVPTVTTTVGTQSSTKNKPQDSPAETAKKPNQEILKAINFDELYEYIKQQLATEKISLSIRNMRKAAHQHLKQHPSLADLSISITNTNYLVNKIRDKMLAAQFIIENPNYRKGKAKYLLTKNATQQKPHKATKTIPVNADVFV
jgi:hypothetical protein